MARRTATAFIGATLSVVLLAGNNAAVAQRWTLQPSLRSSVDYNSNRSLVAEALPGLGLALQLDAPLSYTSEVLNFSLRPSLSLQRFDNTALVDSDDQTLDFNASWRRERADVKLDAVWRSQNTLLTELVDTGVLDAGTRRRDALASVGWNAFLSERVSGGVQASFADVEFSGRAAQRLPGYRFPGVAANGSLALDARKSLSATLNLSELQVPSSSLRTRNSGASVGFAYGFSERTEFEVNGGFSRTESGFASDSGWIGQLRVRTRYPRSFWSAGISRSVQPSGFGVLVRRLELSASHAYDISPRVRFAASARAVRNDSLLGAASGERRHIRDLDARFEWRASETWSLGFRAGIAQASGPVDELQAGPGERDYDGWRVGLSMAWAPRALNVAP